ncbi:NADH-ubiquinone oxidoreductase [Rhodotorula toruloides]|uniref:NADH-ubiquinone oxidoreductase n=1 Tax=Rhodotorula toruloides TaxID=5286 RepID=A0A511KCW9_RHOTO|nr:NADH-ubiquinone oxidoreductase [Rhodotorula toruloides]
MSRAALALLPRTAARRAPARRVQQLASRRPASTHAHSAAETEYYPPETFNKPFWRNLSLIAVGTFLYSRYAPDDALQKVEDAVDERTPNWLSRYLSHNFGVDGSQYKERNDEHIQLVKKQADAKLLTQSATKPVMNRIRYVGSFEQASPYNIEIGSQADLSDLIVKSAKDDAAALQ